MSQDNIFREVDEELRSDRMRKLWKRFAPLVIGAAIGVVVLVAVNEGWAWYQSSNAAKSSDQLYAAFAAADGGDLAKAKTELDALIANGTGGYPTLAKFREAGLLAKDGKTADAVAAYDALSTAESNTRLRELALVLAGTLLVDTGSLDDVKARVDSIAIDGSPLRNAAREALGLAQYKAGDFTGAQTSFEAVLNDPLSDNTVRTRMGYYLAQLLSQGAIAPKTPEQKAADSIDQMVQGGGTTPADGAATTPAATPDAGTTPAADAPVVEK